MADSEDLVKIEQESSPVVHEMEALRDAETFAQKVLHPVWAVEQVV